MWVTGSFLLLAFVFPRHVVAGPAEEYQSLVKEYDAAMQEFYKVYGEAKTEEAKAKAYEKCPRNESYTGRFLALAEKHPKEPLALDALQWVILHTQHGPEFEKALKIIADVHIQNEKIGPICELLTNLPIPMSEQLLRGILEKNTYHEAKGYAALSLGQFLKNESAVAHYLKELNPASLAGHERYYGKDGVEKMLHSDPKKLTEEAEKSFEQVIEKYGDIKFGERTLADFAKAELFEIRNLTIGKVAPEIEGVDVDGKAFKLSDYRGKVVVLDFWGDW